MLGRTAETAASVVAVAAAETDQNCPRLPGINLITNFLKFPQPTP